MWALKNEFPTLFYAKSIIYQGIKFLNCFLNCLVVIIQSMIDINLNDLKMIEILGYLNKSNNRVKTPLRTYFGQFDAT